MRFLKIFCLVFSIILNFTQASPELSLGELDPTFGDAGRVTFESERFLAARELPDGKIISVGSYCNEKFCFLYWHQLQKSGKPDLTSMASGFRIIPFQPKFQPLVASFDPNGNLIVGGYFGTGVGMLKFAPTGEADATFGTKGVAQLKLSHNSDRVEKIAFDNRGNIVIVGNTMMGGNTGIVARFNAAGKLDATFGDAGSLLIRSSSGLDTSAGLYDLSFDIDNNILVAGYGFNWPKGYALLAARVLPTGKLDASFANQGIFVFWVNHADSNQAVHQILPGTAGDVWLVGHCTEPPLVKGGYVVTHLLRGGKFDPKFGNEGVFWLTEGPLKFGGAHRAILAPEQGLLVIGIYPTDNRIGFGIISLNRTGQLDPNFGVGGFGLHFLDKTWSEAVQFSIFSDRVFLGTRPGNDTVLMKFGNLPKR